MEAPILAAHATADGAPQRLWLRLPEDALAGPEADTPRHTMRAFAVAPVLRGTLAHLLAYRETLPAGQTLVERVLPDGALRLTVQLGARPRAELVGAWSAPALVPLHGAMHGLTATLQPGAALALLGVPARLLSGRVLGLEDLWGTTGRDLAEQVAAAKGDAARAKRLQCLLQARLAQSEAAMPAPLGAALHALARHAGEDDATPPVRTLARRLGLGERRVQQLFAEHVGLSPRSTFRLARLQALLRQLRRTPRPPWAELALAHGFCDQAHLAREFRALVGLTPRDFAARVRRPADFASVQDALTPGR